VTDPVNDQALAAQVLRRYGPKAAGKRLGVSARAVERWAAGERKPLAPQAERLREVASTMMQKVDPPAPAAPALPAGERDALTVCRANVARLERDLERTEDEALRAKLSGALTTANTLLAKLTHSMEVNQSAILRSAAWGRIERAFESVFARHPEADAALKEFVAELQEMGE
jgi:transcriptional regulator with XRE-family HTH domain